jgi:iron complex transport system substrate-binding protein
VRIVSLLPSATEILFAVGAGDEVVGVTFECDFPPEARTRRIVSNTALSTGLTPAEIDREVRARIAAGDDLYTLDEGALRDLDPDVIVTQDLCAVCAVDVANVDDALAHLGCHAEVVTTDPMTLEEVLVSIRTLARLTGNHERGDAIVAALQDRLDRVSRAVAARPRPRFALLEWTEPLFGPGHWLPDMIEAAGATNVLGGAGGRSRAVQWDELHASQPDAVVVAPCGFGLAGATDLAANLVEDGRLPAGVPVHAVDADAAFVRPGPRVVDGVEALAGIAHPDAVAPRADLATRVA